MKIAIGVEYNGRGFSGWQSQKEGTRTVQTTVQDALSIVANEPIKLFCAGRTDTGVHGIEQVAHFETNAKRDERSWILGANSNLPDDVSILWTREMDDDFHARFSAMGRSYRYQILNRTARSALLADRATWIFRPLDVGLMREAAKILLGEHDFSSFRAQGCQAKSAIKTIHALDIHCSGDIIELRIHANAFLYHMVRNIAGVLISIGQGDKPVAWMAEVLAAKDRKKGGVTARPDGLYFERVYYPEHYQLPQLGLGEVQDATVLY